MVWNNFCPIRSDSTIPKREPLGAWNLLVNKCERQCGHNSSSTYIGNRKLLYVCILPYRNHIVSVNYGKSYVHYRFRALSPFQSNHQLQHKCVLSCLAHTLLYRKL
jgi:hypothetical protein